MDNHLVFIAFMEIIREYNVKGFRLLRDIIHNVGQCPNQTNSYCRLYVPVDHFILLALDPCLKWINRMLCPSDDVERKNIYV